MATYNRDDDMRKRLGASFRKMNDIRRSLAPGTRTPNADEIAQRIMSEQNPFVDQQPQQDSRTFRDVTGRPMTQQVGRTVGRDFMGREQVSAFGPRGEVSRQASGFGQLGTVRKSGRTFEERRMDEAEARRVARGGKTREEMASEFEMNRLKELGSYARAGESAAQKADLAQQKLGAKTEAEALKAKTKAQEDRIKGIQEGQKVKRTAREKAQEEKMADYRQNYKEYQDEYRAAQTSRGRKRDLFELERKRIQKDKTSSVRANLEAEIPPGVTIENEELNQIANTAYDNPELASNMLKRNVVKKQLAGLQAAGEYDEDRGAYLMEIGYETEMLDANTGEMKTGADLKDAIKQVRTQLASDRQSLAATVTEDLKKHQASRNERITKEKEEAEANLTSDIPLPEAPEKPEAPALDKESWASLESVELQLARAKSTQDRARIAKSLGYGSIQELVEDYQAKGYEFSSF